MKNWKKRLCLGCLLLCILLGFTSCTTTKNIITNEVTNEITNKVVEYEKLTVTDLENAIETAVEKVENAVIGVNLKEVSKVDTSDSEDSIGVGSGVIYKAEEIYEGNKLVNYKYYVVTNRHVVVDEEKKLSGSTKIYVYIGSEDLEIEANLVGYETKVDIALITFEHSTKIQPISFGDSSAVKKGSFVIAIGNPAGFDYYGSVTFGVVSSPLRYVSVDTDNDDVNDFYEMYIQHDASINPGNSGGGLFNLEGELIGINAMKLSSTSIDNMGFAITANEVKDILENYLEKGLVIERAKLGVTGIEVKSLTPQVIKKNDLLEIPDIYEPNEANYGIYVSEVLKDGSCGNSGLEKNDIILEFDGVKIKKMSELGILLRTKSVGESAILKYYDRSTKTIEEVTIILKK